jgi:hypothetical protein
MTRAAEVGAGAAEAVDAAAVPEAGAGAGDSPRAGPVGRGPRWRHGSNAGVVAEPQVRAGRVQVRVPLPQLVAAEAKPLAHREAVVARCGEEEGAILADGAALRGMRRRGGLVVGERSCRARRYDGSVGCTTQAVMLYSKQFD